MRAKPVETITRVNIKLLNTQPWCGVVQRLRGASPSSPNCRDPSFAPGTRVEAAFIKAVSAGDNGRHRFSVDGRLISASNRFRW
jgi:hypothetical protein